MDKIKTVEDFKKFLNNNRDKLLDLAIHIKDLPPDDEWIQDDEWDKVYKNEVITNGKVQYWYIWWKQQTMRLMYLFVIIHQSNSRN